MLVEDDERTRTVMESLLRSAGYAVVTAANGKVAVGLLLTQPVDLVLTDLVMPEKDGIELILEMRKGHRNVPVIAFSGYGSRAAGNYLKIAEKFGVRAILEKPFTNSELMGAIRSVLGGGPAAPIPADSTATELTERIQPPADQGQAHEQRD